MLFNVVDLIEHFLSRSNEIGCFGAYLSDLAFDWLSIIGVVVSQAVGCECGADEKIDAYFSFDFNFGEGDYWIIVIFFGAFSSKFSKFQKGSFFFLDLYELVDMLI